MVTVAVCILPAIGSTVLLSRPTMQSFLENIKKCYNSFFSYIGHKIEHPNIFAYFKHVHSVFFLFFFVSVAVNIPSLLFMF